MDESQQKLFNFLIGNRMNVMDDFTKKLDSIRMYQKILYNRHPDDQDVIEYLCQIDDLTELCINLIYHDYNREENILLSGNL